MEDKETTIIQYADDTCLTVKANEKSVQEVISVFERFEKYSCNYDKTEITPTCKLQDT